MKRSWLLVAALLIIAMPAAAVAATLNVEFQPSALVINPGGTASARLRLRNVGALPAQLGVWQVNVSLAPMAPSTGAVTMTAVDVPSPYIFAGIPSFGPTLAFGGTLPAASAILTDAATGFGQNAVLASAGDANLVDIQFTASVDAAGTFHVMLPPLSDDFTDSSWFDVETLSSASFGNGGASSTPAERLLLTITVPPVPEPSAFALGLGISAAATSLPRRSTSRRDRPS